MANLTPQQISQLPLAYQQAGQEIQQYINDNWNKLSDDQYASLSSQARAIFLKCDIMFQSSTLALDDQISASITQLNSSVAQINKALSVITDVQDAINIASTLVDLGIAIISANPQSVISGVGTLLGQVQTIIAAH